MKQPVDAESGRTPGPVVGGEGSHGEGAPEALTRTVELIRRTKEGDDEATERLFERYYPIVVRIVELRLRRRVRGHQVVEDLVQETLLDVFRGLDHFVMRSEGDFRNWLATVVSNNIRDHFRRAGAVKRGEGRARRWADLPESALSTAILPGGEPTPSENVRANELEERIERALAEELDEAHREVIVLRRLCEMSFEEVAHAMGYPRTSSVRSLYSRAMKALREAVEG